MLVDKMPQRKSQVPCQQSALRAAGAAAERGRKICRNLTVSDGPFEWEETVNFFGAKTVPILFRLLSDKTDAVSIFSHITITFHPLATKNVEPEQILHHLTLSAEIGSWPIPLQSFFQNP
jgi:hypothetical protein